MFHLDEPGDGHFERFEARLKTQQRKSKIRLAYKVSRIAAIELLVITSSLWAYSKLFDNDPTMMRLSDVNPEMAEVEFFFTSQIEYMTDQVKNIEMPSEEEIKEEMLQEIHNMDSIYLNLQVELATYPGEERIVESMIRYYKTKLVVIERIINQLTQIQENNNNKKNQYESVNF